MTKYKQVVQEMIDAHAEVFHSFKKIHDAYVQHPDKMQKQLNEEGQKVLHIIQRYENILCSKSESGKYGKFSSKLAEKYWQEIKVHFPKIDYIGLQ